MVLGVGRGWLRFLVKNNPFGLMLGMNPREVMVAFVWASLVISGVLLLSVLFFVRPFPVFSKDSVVAFDAVVDAMSEMKGGFVNIGLENSKPGGVVSSFIIPSSRAHFFVGQRVSVLVDSGRRFPEQKGYVWEVRGVRGDLVVDSRDIGLYDRYIERQNRDVLLGFVSVQFFSLLVLCYTWHRCYSKTGGV